MSNTKQKTTGLKVWGAVLMLGLASTAQAGHGEERNSAEVFSVQARVIKVEPLLRTVQVTVPQEVCWQEPVQHRASRFESATPKVLGGVLGGVVGNQFGGGRGNKLLTVAGAVLGASIGRDIAHQRSQRKGSYVTYEKVCEIEQLTHEEQRSDGYRILYTYAGREFITYSDVAPGKFVQVRVQIEPVAL